MDILLPLVLAEMPEAAIEQACALAAALPGRITALVGVSLFAPNATNWKYFPEGACVTLEEVAKVALHRELAKVQRRFERECVQREIRVSNQFWLTPAENTLRSAHCTDLIVLGGRRPILDVEASLFAGVLAASGRPVLLVPSGCARKSIDKVLVAWKPTFQAARAVHDALPLLRRARQVDVLTVEPPMSPNEDPEPAEQIAAHLGRHAVQARVVHVERKLASAGQRILDQVRESGADLIVCGGYSHPRALEHVMGGTTKALRDRSPVPVLFSH